MSLRPNHTRWFELLLPHDDLTDTMEALAHTGNIELERRDHSHLQMDLQDLQLRLQDYTKLQRYYQSFWPKPDTGFSPFNGSPVEIFDKALKNIHSWEKEAQPEIQNLELIEGQLNNMHLLELFLSSKQFSTLDYSLLSTDGSGLIARLFLLPSKSRLQDIPETILWKIYKTKKHHSKKHHSKKYKFLLLVATVADLDALTAELIQKKHTFIHIPALPADKKDAQKRIIEKQQELETDKQQRQNSIDELNIKYQLSLSIGEIQKMDWFLRNIPSLPASNNFVWITGWTSDNSGNSLHKALALQGSRAILHFPGTPDGASPPLVLKNPWWAKPFEIFIKMMGTPGSNEADPSRLLSILAPLLFGYMFGDVGQGFILLMAGLLLRKRWPLLKILIANGASAMLFGFIFGSMFGREDLIPALWLHPVAQPLPVLAIPLLGGILIILLGLTLSALQSYWRGEWQRWLRQDASVIFIYLGIISLFFIPNTASVIIFSALIWHIIGNTIQANNKISAALSSLGLLLESMMQLVLNTVSFVRVGAFALAHAGLSMAFNIMADNVSSTFIALLIILLGNIIVIVLEGVVVSIQTTRLILFEFFIRFLQANGRIFKPLRGPVSEIANG
jgi:V/A-type H+-transporting ATPase subunit I